jgi:hypothetical protein
MGIGAWCVPPLAMRCGDMTEEATRCPARSLTGRASGTMVLPRPGQLAQSRRYRIAFPTSSFR